MTHQSISPITHLVSIHPPIHLSSTDLFGHLSAIIHISNNPFIHSFITYLLIHLFAIQSFTYPLLHLFIHALMYPCMYACIQLSIIQPCICLSIHLIIHPFIQSSTHAFIYAPMHPRIHVCVHACIHMFTDCLSYTRP